MKPILCFCLFALVSTGCLGPKETQASKPPAAEIEPPPPVKAEEINEGNVREKFHQLAEEIDFAEHAAQVAAPKDKP